MNAVSLAQVPDIPWQRINDLLLACGSEREPKRLVDTFIRKVAGIVPFDSARAFIVDGTNVIEDSISFGIESKWMRRYEDTYSTDSEGRYSVLNTASDLAGIGTVFSYEGTGAICTEYDLSDGTGDLDFLMDYLEPQSIRYSLSTTLTSESGEAWSLVILERGRMDRFDARECAIFSLVATHLENMSRDLFATPRKSWRLSDEVELTPREREVALLTLRGMTPDAISRELRISRWTVYHHVDSLHKKLGVRNSAQLMTALGAMGDSLG